MSQRNLHWEEADEVPLMKKLDDEKSAQRTNPTSAGGEGDVVFFADNNSDSDDDDSDEKPFRKHDITLWVSDAIVMVIEHLQYYAVLLSLSEYWGWPVNWIDATSFTFIFNFDIWNLRKVDTGLFHHSTTTFADTNKMGLNYTTYLALWAVILCGITAVFGVIYLRWMKRRPLHLLLYIARWKRVMFMTLQFLSVPFGLAAARIFHCGKENAAKTYEVMVVQNDVECYSAEHITFMVLVLFIFFFIFLFYPIILMKWVSDQVFSGDPKRHEGSLQLKEAEYEQGLDMLWDIGQYYLFSSYKRAWIHYNPLKFVFKFLFIAAFALSVQSPFWASASITTLFCVAVMALICRRPFRVRCFNVMMISSHFLIACNALIGNFMVRPPWESADDFMLVSFLRNPSLLHILMTINMSWLIIVVCWIVYLVLVNRSIIGGERIWPRLSYNSSNTIGEDTKKYLKAALRARHTLERALSAIPLFAPIHELAHQIKVVNAYCREAEYIGDPTHDTLWDLLDELIEAHNTLSAVSVFGMSGKTSVKETSEEFIRLMPSFRKRLKQREYDFILMPPVKRRLLLKMYILSVFINNGRRKNPANRTPGQDVAMKLQDALTMFETRSLMSDFDTGIGSSSPSVTLSSNSRPISTRGTSNMTGFIDDVDALIGTNTDDVNNNNNNNSAEQLQGTSKQSFSESTNSRPATAQTLSPHFRTSTSTRAKISSPVHNGVDSDSHDSLLSVNKNFDQEEARKTSKTSVSSQGRRKLSDHSATLAGASRQTTPTGTSRSSTPSRSAVFMSKEMPSTASIPGQIDEEQLYNMKQSTTMLQ